MTKKAQRTVHIIAKHGEQLARIIKVSFQQKSIVVSNFRGDDGIIPDSLPRRVEHLTYPPDGRVHLTTDSLRDFPDHIDPDPLKLYDERGRNFRDPGHPLASFTGRHQLALGYIFLSSNAMSGLRYEKSIQPHDLVIEGIVDGVAFGYAVDLVEPDGEVVASAITHRRMEAASVSEAFVYHLVEHLRPCVLISLRVKGTLYTGMSMSRR